MNGVISFLTRFLHRLCAYKDWIAIGFSFIAIFYSCEANKIARDGQKIQENYIKADSEFRSPDVRVGITLFSNEEENDSAVITFFNNGEEKLKKFNAYVLSVLSIERYDSKNRVMREKRILGTNLFEQWIKFQSLGELGVLRSVGGRKTLNEIEEKFTSYFRAENDVLGESYGITTLFFPIKVFREKSG